MKESKERDMGVKKRQKEGKKMRKLYQAEERKNQEICEILARLRNELSEGKTGQNRIDDFLAHYERTINLTFIANALHYGLKYAERLYNQIVKMEYKRFTQFVIKQPLDSKVKEYIFLRLKKVKKRLLLHSPRKKENYGLDILYLVTGGRRKKYSGNQQFITQMYTEIKNQSKKSSFNYFKDRWQLKVKYFKSKRDYRKWAIKSYIQR